MDLFGRLKAKVPAGAKLLFDMDNHDTVTDWPERIEVMAGHDGMEMIQVMNYLLDCIPMVYSGNELADTARVSMFANRFHPGRYEVTDRHHTDEPAARERRRELMTALNRLRRESNILCYGGTEFPAHTEEKTVFSFARVHEGARLTFVGNMKRDAVTTTPDRMPRGEVLFSNHAEPRADGTIALGAYGYIVFSEK